MKDQLLALVLTSAMVLSAVFVYRNLKYIRNYRHEYLLEFPNASSITIDQLSAITGLYDIHQINDNIFRVSFDEPMEKLEAQLKQTLTLDTSDFKVSQLHSWLKTNL